MCLESGSSRGLGSLFGVVVGRVRLPSHQRVNEPLGRRLVSRAQRGATGAMPAAQALDITGGGDEAAELAAATVPHVSFSTTRPSSAAWAESTRTLSPTTSSSSRWG